MSERLGFKNFKSIVSRPFNNLPPEIVLSSHSASICCAVSSGSRAPFRSSTPGILVSISNFSASNTVTSRAATTVDVIVLARGGGSFEDLLPFSDESLVRAVAAAHTPVVSAIGHEADSPIVDAVADVRASTPTDAGKRIVPDVAEEFARISEARGRIDRAIAGYLSN